MNYLVAGGIICLLLEVRSVATTEWERECMRWHRRILRGEKAHWCLDWDQLPVDETCPEWPCSCKINPKDNSRPIKGVS